MAIRERDLTKPAEPVEAQILSFPDGELISPKESTLEEQAKTEAKKIRDVLASTQRAIRKARCTRWPAELEGSKYRVPEVISQGLTDAFLIVDSKSEEDSKELSNLGFNPDETRDVIVLTKTGDFLITVYQPASEDREAMVCGGDAEDDMPVFWAQIEPENIPLEHLPTVESIFRTPVEYNHQTMMTLSTFLTDQVKAAPKRQD